MIYEIKGKYPRPNIQYTKSEDVLTGTIFGHLRYFNNQDILIDFINMSEDIFGHNPSIYTSARFNIEFWPNFPKDNGNGFDQPDLILKNADIDIIIECKYHSVLEENGNRNDKDYSNQLIRYSRIINNSETMKRKLIIFLTDDKTMPKDIMQVTQNRLAPGISLYWLSWSMLYSCLIQKDISLFNIGEQLLFNDIKAFLEKRKLLIFTGLHLFRYNLGWHYNKIYRFGNKTKISWRYSHEKK